MLFHSHFSIQLLILLVNYEFFERNCKIIPEFFFFWECQKFTKSALNSFKADLMGLFSSENNPIHFLFTYRLLEIWIRKSTFWTCETQAFHSKKNISYIFVPVVFSLLIVLTTNFLAQFLKLWQWRCSSEWIAFGCRWFFRIMVTSLQPLFVI